MSSGQVRYSIGFSSIWNHRLSSLFCVGSSTVVSSAPDVMFSEVLLIFFVLGIWLSAIGFCLHQYKSLRRLETQVHYCVNRKDPLNIGDIKIVSREQDSIIYKKKRYSTMADTHVNNEDLKQMHYVQEYLPKPTVPPSSVIHSLVLDRQDLTAQIPLSVTSSITPPPPSTHLPLSTHDEVSEEQPVPSTPLTPSYLLEAESSRNPRRISYAQRPGNCRYFKLPSSSSSVSVRETISEKMTFISKLSSKLINQLSLLSEYHLSIMCA